jgi:hypothetical protein
MQDTSGFYKNEDGLLLYGKNYVLSGSYNLYKEKKDEYSYPVGNWYWFDTEEQARTFFNLPKPPEQEFPPFGNNLPKY